MKFTSNLILFAVLFIFTVSLFSCMNDDPFEAQKANEQQLISNYIKTYGNNAIDLGSGMYIIHDEIGTGDTVSVGDEVIFSYYGYALSAPNKIFDTSNKDTANTLNLTTYAEFGDPAKVLISSAGGFYSLGVLIGLLKMSEGGKATFVLPGSFMFGDYNPFVYKVTLHKVINNSREFEIAQIDSFFKTRSIMKNDSTLFTYKDTTGTITGEPEGLYIFNHVQTGGLSIENKDSVIFKYTLSLLPISDRTKNLEVPERIVNNYYNKTVKIKYGVSTAFPMDCDGFVGALKFLNSGDKARVIIPAHRGYGNNIIVDALTTQWQIPQNSSLLYDIEILSVIKN